MDEEGRQLRPDVVFFGEDMKHREEAIDHLKTAARVLVVGTSLQVYPAAGLLKKARFHAEKVLVAKEIFVKQYGFPPAQSLEPVYDSTCYKVSW